MMSLTYMELNITGTRSSPSSIRYITRGSASLNSTSTKQALVVYYFSHHNSRQFLRNSY